MKSLALQKLSRLTQREYTKHGNSNCFKSLKKKMKARIKLENNKALKKVFEQAGEKGSKWICEATRFSARPGEDRA